MISLPSHSKHLLFREWDKAHLFIYFFQGTGGVGQRLFCPFRIAFLQIGLILDQLRKSAFPSAGAFSSARRIAEYLGEHFGEEIKLSQLAGEFSYSTDHMIRIFKQHFQMTPHQYLIEVRTSEAKRLLLSTDWPMDQIASAAGFRDLTAFYRDFKQKTGISPGKWRRRMQGLELPQS